MRYLLALMLMLPVLAWGQSSLPPCTAAETDLGARRHNCFGTVTSPSGRKYVGEWRDDKYHGQGTLTFPDGKKYVGEWRDGLRNGQGTWTLPDGGRYVGEWRDGKSNGQGIVYRANGSIHFSGRWENNQPVQEIALDTNRFPFNSPVADAGKAERDRLAAELEAERKKRAESEARQLAETRERERLAAEAKERDRLAAETERRRQQEHEQKLAAETRERERLSAEAEVERKKRAEAEARQLAETRERERLAAEAEAERKKRQELEEQLAKQERPSVPPPPTAAVPRNPHALVIGNAAYPGSGRLDNPINDATAISQKLRAMGFTVTVVNDANRQRLVQAMSQFRKSASAADLSLLFYSGHGVQIFGTNYILPIDADQSDVAQATIQGVSLNSVVESFLPGKTKIVFLDACRDNPLQRAGDRSVSKGLAPISVAQGTLISYATKDGQTASDGVGQKNSPFTTALLQHLSDPEDIAVVLRKVREKVMAATGGKQQPWEYGSLTGGALVLSAIKR